MNARTFSSRLLPVLTLGLLLTTAWPACAAQPKATPAPAAGKKPGVGTLANNAATTAKIKTALLADKVAPGMAINVDTNAGVVTLSGQVETQAQKSRSEQIAKQTKGVTKVINHLTIKPKVAVKRDAGTVANDAATTAKIKAALAADKVAPGMAINVDTKAGMVTLSGQVSTDAQKKRAGAIAMKTKGVTKVVTHLTLKPRASR